MIESRNGRTVAFAATHQQSSASQSDEIRLSGVLEEYLAQIERGERPDRDAIIGRHPDLAEQLHVCLDGLDLLQRVVPELNEASGPVPTPPQALGDFRILRELGRGGMGVVYEAEQLSLGRRIALKVLPFAAILDKQQLARFKNEARAAATLDHPNIVAIYSVGSDRGVHYYAMQLIEGQSLAEVIAHVKLGRPPSVDGSTVGAGIIHKTAGDTDKAALPTEQTSRNAAFFAHTTPGSSLPAFSSRDYFRGVARLGIQAAQALDHAHQNGILHRDIKPANLLLDDAGKLWVTDFGLARIEQDAGVTMTGDLLGTLRYMSPEQALANQVVIDHRCDIYSLGATLYELLTLRPVFAGNDRHALLRQIAFAEPPALRKLEPRIPAELETIVLKSIAKNPVDRYATAKLLASDLHAYLDNRPIMAKPPTLFTRAAHWSRRNVPLLWSAAAALLTSTLILLVASLQITQSYQQAESQRGEAARQRLLAVEQLAVSQKQEQAAKRARDESETNLYFSDLQLAPELWHKGQVSQLHGTLDRYLPQPSEQERRGWEWYYYLSKCHEAQLSIYGHHARVDAVAWSPNGNFLASSSRDDNTVRLWNAADGKEAQVFREADADPWSLSWSPDGRYLASGGRNVVRVWDIVTSKVSQRFKLSAGASFSHVRWSPSGTFLAASRSNDLCHIWNAKNGELIETLPAPAGREKGRVIIGWHPKEDRLAFIWSQYADRIRIWNTKDHKEELQSYKGYEGGDVNDLKWSPDGGQIAITGQYARADIWDVKTGERKAITGPKVYVRSIAWDPAGKCLAMASHDNRLWIADLKDPSAIKQYRGHTGKLWTVDWSPDGKRVASSGDDGIINIWDPLSNAATKIFAAHDSLITAIVWNSDGDKFATAAGKSVHVYSPSGELLSKIAVPTPVDRVAWKRDGTLLAASVDGNNVRIWDPVRNGQFAEMSPPEMLSHYDWSRDGGKISLGGGGKGLNIYDALKGRLISSDIKDGNFVCSWSPKSKQLLVGSVGFAYLFDPAAGEITGRLAIPSVGRYAFINASCWSPNGEYVALFAGNLGWVADTSTLQPVAYLRGNGGEVSSIAWSPDARRLATIADGDVTLWDVTSGRQLVQLRELPSQTRLVDWSPDGKKLLLAGSTGEVAILDATKGFVFAGTPQYDMDRVHRLVTMDRRADAVQLLEKLVADHPHDEQFSQALRYHKQRLKER